MNKSLTESFKGKRVLVTGASSGLGFQIASDFLSEGAFVGAHYASNRRGAEKLLESVPAEQCQLLQSDFSRSQEVLRLWDGLMEWTQHRIDILVNNAGEATQPMPCDQLTEEAWDRTFQINLKAPFLLSRAALSIMSRQGSGRIINVSSIGVKFGGSHPPQCITLPPRPLWKPSLVACNTRIGSSVRAKRRWILGVGNE